jgi:large subunit ribosomal protein L46
MSEAVDLSSAQASLILSRIPIITPTLTAFEEAYYHYQDELERRLMWTFPQHYYYKKGSLSERKFVAAQTWPVSRLPGVLYPRGVPDIKFNRERRFKQEILVPNEEEEGSDGSLTSKIVPNPRTTAADKAGDIKSLIRKLDRTLYLVVKNQSNEWKFPSFQLNHHEPLHETVEKGLRELGGVDMNTWTVSNTPAAFVQNNSSKEFFIKSHIIHGQFKLTSQQTLITDFAWLTKDELQDNLGSIYYDKLEPVLSNQ